MDYQNTISFMIRKLSALVIILCLFVSFGCGSKKIPKGMSDAELYEAAMEKLSEKKGGFPWVFRGRDYETIFKLFKEIQIRYTYSPYATLAELRTADVFFDKEEFPQAAIEYEEFMKRHPGHQEISYATYRLALSHFKEVRSPDRDPTSTREALKWFVLFITKFPDSPLVPDAEERIVRCRLRLAKREIDIGDFYTRRKNHIAAANRYRVVVEIYSDTKKYEKALYLLGRAYARSDQFDLARGTLNKLIEESSSDNKYHGKATKLLGDISNKTTPLPEPKEEAQQG